MPLTVSVPVRVLFSDANASTAPPPLSLTVPATVPSPRRVPPVTLILGAVRVPFLNSWVEPPACVKALVPLTVRLPNASMKMEPEFVAGPFESSVAALIGELPARMISPLLFRPAVAVTRSGPVMLELPITRALELVLLFVRVPVTVRLDPPSLLPSKFGSSPRHRYR